MLYTLTHKYLSEQVEEHSKMQDLVDQLETFGEDKIALRLLDDSL
jgi:ferritin